MLLYPNAKLNLGLRVTGRRMDGYHTLQTIFYPLPLCDVLEVAPSRDQRDHLYISGRGYVDDPNNLVIKALKSLRNRLGDDMVPPTTIALDKHIPSMAGLGGGSSDGAFTLNLLNEIYNLNLSQDELSKIALSLGADCPFFLLNSAALATGIGEELEPLPNLSLSGCSVLVVRPPIDVSTPKAYAALGFDRGEQREGLPIEVLQLLRDGHFEDASKWLTNDFENVVFEEYPRLRNIKDILIQNGAFFSLMSGSGSAIYGLFEDVKDAEKLISHRDFEDCFRRCLSL
ncbi:4-(cytidine 5'-diphospho)-2-C-methyl-D-erythritol kinase [Falsiporphyromonas endometrii]|uniref:4-diphosphocytidyl-2-C-methyl-D-erythritol kinase n=1 Tax=Falsiporphyromonas endometrii TaxID=1387297 RepID=A0ABV9K6M1_9PORP